MSDEIRPALSEAEWSGEESIAVGHASGKMGWFIPIADSWRTGGDLVLKLHSSPSQNTDWPIADRHALAALCLYQQPFGFTHEDVDWLQQCAEFHAHHHHEHAARYGSLAARIAALLPPEKP